ncbi:MAG: tRNA uridine(34) 5-carboxymethylaminomethyl modification radical SAM/GNAT enzyme Elp3 [Anaerolineales bacterium]|nr:tRNA uridine(34) 5-carboxymethylaminomethyl modification radical SAM/GNAT enzyme Elp3 [Anaerolineales bacterium]
MEIKDWWAARSYSADKFALARLVLEEVRAGKAVDQAVRKYPLPDGAGYLGKNALVAAYRQLTESGEWPADADLLARIRMKPVRTLSGVTVVTVLTKPYPCPGKCIFCPTDARMPKSYLPDEPGAMRALHHKFDPYDQVVARLEALQAVGHPTDKIELLILGGTWSAYRKDYQEWFVKRCFDALNGENSESLEAAQVVNEQAAHRNVGLVVESRPDHINIKELAWLRTLGVTKLQIGVQSLNGRILEMNKRGHSVEDTRTTVGLLRRAGFKIVLHWMPNLLGSTIESDRQDFLRLWDGFCPDEIKIYPTQLLANAELYQYWQDGKFTPYTTQELVDLIADIKTSIPRYCRVNRVVRDIPSTNVVEGNKRTSLRQDIQREMRRRGSKCQCIRCREIRKQTAWRDNIHLDDLAYKTDRSEEHFLSYVTPNDKIVGFLRLSLPSQNSRKDEQFFATFPELVGSAIIREVHVYGQSLELGAQQGGVAQHIGLGSQLIAEAEEIAARGGYKRIAVISAVGTRAYYLQRGYRKGGYYMLKDLCEDH